MTNLDTYNHAFIKIFNIGENELVDLQYEGIAEWDSVGHMELIAELEDGFSIMMDTEDIIELNSYEMGKTILRERYGIQL